eukprot:7543584-Ditylum_brightwellii.AAC.1
MELVGSEMLGPAIPIIGPKECPYIWLFLMEATFGFIAWERSKLLAAPPNPMPNPAIFVGAVLNCCNWPFNGPFPTVDHWNVGKVIPSHRIHHHWNRRQGSDFLPEAAPPVPS